MQLTLMRTTKDILYFVIVLVIFISCAALGIHLLYVNYNDEWRIKVDAVVVVVIVVVVVVVVLLL